jgi:hypothetical protein
MIIELFPFVSLVVVFCGQTRTANATMQRQWTDSLLSGCLDSYIGNHHPEFVPPAKYRGFTGSIPVERVLPKIEHLSEWPHR